MYRTNGFTLVELLVVIGIVAALLALLSGPLLRAKDSALAVGCQANLRTVHQGYLMYIDGPGNGRMPYVRRPWQGSPDWDDALNWTYEYAPSLHANGEQSFNACPAVQREYHHMTYYALNWGYTPNWGWSKDGSEAVDGKMWAAIRNPTQYPLFMDGEVYPFGSGHSIAPRAPYTGVVTEAFGVGFHHGGGQRGNVAWADGSVRPVERSDVLDVPDGEDPNFYWFANR